MKGTILLEVLITFAVILFAGFSVTFGVLIGRRKPGHGCHAEFDAAGKVQLSKCESCNCSQ